MNIRVIETTQELNDVCARFKTAEFITLDTEFLRKTTYYAKLCLIQMASDEEAVIIDPLANGIDLSAFYDLMNGGPVKVIHAARQDIEIFLHDSGHLPKPIFDTQIAAMVCGYGDSVGYETLVKSLVNKSIDKSARFTDWSRRPLSQKQLSYAISDVTHLREIYRALCEKLEKNNRMSWLKEEVTILTNPSTYTVVPEESWLRLKCRSNNRRFLAYVRELTTWREKLAQQRNVPRNRILRDEIILELAAHPAESKADLTKVRGFPKNLLSPEFANDLIGFTEKVASMGDDELPEVKRNANNMRHDKAGPVLELLKVLLKIRSQESGVAAKLITNSSELEDIALGRGQKAKIPALIGWRYQLFGSDALKLLNGELALSADGEDIKITYLS